MIGRRPRFLSGLDLDCQLLDNGFLRGSLLAGGFLRCGAFWRFFVRLLRRPTLPGRFGYRLSASLTHLSLRLVRSHDWRCRFGFALNSGPSPLLGFFHLEFGRIGEFPTLPGRVFRCGGGLGGATNQDAPKIGNLSIYPFLLCLEALDGCGDDLVVSFCVGMCAITYCSRYLILGFETNRGRLKPCGDPKRPSSQTSYASRASLTGK